MPGLPSPTQDLTFKAAPAGRVTLSHPQPQLGQMQLPFPAASIAEKPCRILYGRMILEKGQLDTAELGKKMREGLCSSSTVNAQPQGPIAGQEKGQLA